jgi:ATP-dependent 26S proteasome regulatory subunit
MPGTWREVSYRDIRPTLPPADRCGREFVAQKPIRSLADLIVPDGVRESLELAVRLLEHHDVLYDSWNLRQIDPHRRGTALSLYGPPGTGKSLAAEAIADRLHRTMIDVNYAEIESRYVGETPKNLVRCFEAAQAEGAVLVFNEADAMLSTRLADVTQSADHGVNLSRAVLLTQLDRFDGLVVFTTNTPRSYDPAFVRRILAHVRFDLPDLSTREQLWRTLLPRELPRAADIEPEVLARHSDGLGGGDVVNAIRAAAARAVARDGGRRRVELADLLHEIDAIRFARAEVGTGR